MAMFYKCVNCGEPVELEGASKCPHCGAPIKPQNDADADNGELAQTYNELLLLAEEYRKGTPISDKLRVALNGWEHYTPLRDFERSWMNFVSTVTVAALERNDQDIQRQLKNMAMSVDAERGEDFYFNYLKMYPKLGTVNDWDYLLQKTEGEEDHYKPLLNAIIEHIIHTRDKGFAVDIFNLISSRKSKWRSIGIYYVRGLFENEEVAEKVFTQEDFNTKYSHFASRVRKYCRSVESKGFDVTTGKVWANYVAACKARKRKALIVSGSVAAVLLAVCIGAALYLNAVDTSSIDFSVDKIIEITYGEELPLDGFTVSYWKNSGEAYEEPLTTDMLEGFDREAVGRQQIAYFVFMGERCPVTIIIKAAQLEAPKPVQQGNYVTWDMVPNADYYMVYVNATAVETERTTALSYDLTQNSNYGELTVTVRAMTDSDKYLSSSQSEALKVVKLAAPENILYVDGKLSWNAVAQATVYELTINGTPYVTSVPECAVAFVKGNNTVIIHAKGDSDAVVYGVTEQTIYYDRLNPITSMSYADGNVSWTADAEAKSFAVYVDGQYWKDFSRNYFSVRGDGFAEAFGETTHEIGIVCKAVTVGIESSDVKSWRVALGNRITAEADRFSWTAIGTGATYFVTVNDASYTLGEPYLPLSMCEWLKGDNTVSISARYSGYEYICETITVKKLQSPTLSASDKGWVHDGSAYNRFSVDGGSWSDTLPDIGTLTEGDHTIRVKRVVSGQNVFEIESDVAEYKVKRAATPTVRVDGGEFISSHDPDQFDLVVYYTPANTDAWQRIDNLSVISEAGTYRLRAALIPKESAFPTYCGFLTSGLSKEITVDKPAAPDVSYDSTKGQLSSSTPGVSFYYVDESGNEQEIPFGKTAGMPGGVFKVYARLNAQKPNTLHSDNTPDYARVFVFNLDVDFSVTKTDDRMCAFVFSGCTDIESLTYTYVIEYLDSAGAVIGGIDKSDAPVISSAKRGDSIIQAVNYRLEGILTGSHQFDEVRKLRVTITIDGGSDSMVKTYTLTL